MYFVGFLNPAIIRMHRAATARHSTILAAMLPLVVAVMLLFIGAGRLGAQRHNQVALVAPVTDSARANQNAGPKRVGSAMLGGLIGIVAGGFVGAHVPAHDCHCDDPGLDEFIFGAFAGSIAGAALGASLPDLGSVCAFDIRFTHSIIGAAVTATAAYFVAGGRGSGGTLIGVPVGAIGGSLAGLGHCWKSQ